MSSRNPIRPRGPLRPAPQHVAGGTWRYRDRLVEITDEDRWGRGPGYYAVVTYEWTPKGRDAHRWVEYTGGPADDVLLYGPAPDPHAAMHDATFHIDAYEKFTELARAMPKGTEWRNVDLNVAMWIVKQAIKDAEREGAPLTRADITRRIERKIQATRPGPRLSGAPHADEAISGAAFMRLPLAERVELVDEMLALAGSYRGRWPNPKPDAHLLELHITLLERQLAQLVDECRRIANPADELGQVRAELAECSQILQTVRDALGEREGWRTVPAEVAQTLPDPEALARYAAKWSAEREREATLQLRNAHVLAPHESLVWHDFRVGLLDDGRRMQVKFKPKVEGAPMVSVRASVKQLRRALQAVRQGEFAEDALRDQGVGLEGLHQAAIIEYEDEGGDTQVRAYGVAS